MKSGAEKTLDQLLAEISTSVGRNDWKTVQKISKKILSIDSSNAAAKEPPEPLPSSFADGRYEVKALLGEGARKKVYRAHDTLMDRDVAFALIKAEGLDKEAKKRVELEVRVMGRLGTHPQIVTAHDLGVHEGEQYIVMEHMPDGDVADAILDSQPEGLPLEQAVDITKAVCRGLDYAHSKGVIHRDLKPSNVWLTEQGSVKIGDFGLALSLNRARITKEKIILGTVTYLSPEQATGAEVGPRSDLYSMGVMLYEMVTGRPPFLGDDDVAIVGQHISTAPVAPSWHNAALHVGTLQERDAGGDREKAQSLVQEGLAIAQELGMVPLAKRLTGLLARSETPANAKPSYPDGITPREVEVLGLVAKGFTNQEIGNLLHISIKTVASHIANIYEKSGSANRAEASAYAVRNGLAED